MRFTLLIISSLFSLNLIAQSKIDLTSTNIYKMTAENWCPYTCDSNTKKQGVLTEVVIAALQEVDAKATYYSSTSRIRAIQNTLDGRADLILSAEEEEFEYFDLYKEFFVYDESVLIVRRKDNITLNTTQDMKGYRVGTITEYDYHAPDQEWLYAIHNHKNKVESTINHGEHHLLRLLQRDRIDIAIMNYDVSKHYIEKLGLDNEFQIFRKNIVYKIYPGFAYTERGQAFKALFSKGFNKLKQTDKLRSIYGRYEVTMPEFPEG